MGFGLEPGSQRPTEKKRLLDTAIDHRFDGTKKRPNRRPRWSSSKVAAKDAAMFSARGCSPFSRRRSRAALAQSRRARAKAARPQVAGFETRHEEQGDTIIPFNHRARRAGVQSGVRVGGLSSRLVRKFARGSFRTGRSRSFRTARRSRSFRTAGRSGSFFRTAGRCCSFWTARGCRSFSTSERGRPNGRLLRWRRLPDLSQSRGSQAGARPVRSALRCGAAAAARGVKCGRRFEPGSSPALPTDRAPRPAASAARGRAALRPENIARGFKRRSPQIFEMLGDLCEGALDPLFIGRLWYGLRRF